MSTITDTTEGAVPKKFKSKKLLRYNPNRVAHTLDQLGLGYFSPIARLVGGDEPKKQLREIASNTCLLYTSPSPRDRTRSRMPSSA